MKIDQFSILEIRNSFPRSGFWKKWTVEANEKVKESIGFEGLGFQALAVTCY